MSAQLSATPELISKIPGKPLPESHLFEPKIAQTAQGRKTLGVTTPDHQYFPFIDNEELVFVREGTSRKPFIRLKDGSQVTFNAWRKVRLEGFKETFEKIHPRFITLYTHLLDEYPELEQLGVKVGSPDADSEIARTPGQFRLPDNEHPNPYVVLHENAADAMRDVPDVTLREIAKRVGVDVETLYRDPRIFETFTFVHEVGHARQYIREYLSNRTLSDPAHTYMEKRDTEVRTMLIPGMSPSKLAKYEKDGSLSISKIYEENKLYYLAKGISSPEDLFDAVQVQYRQLPSERYADDFAASVLKKYWNQFNFRI